MTQAVVGIIMGSDSDLPTMKEAIAICEEFSIPCEIAIVSAHRTPERMVEYAQNAHQRGLKVIIAGAGGAAHLPGMIASLTPLPVIGVPVATRHLQGVDSLYSIVQMPAGIPVATVAIGNAKNAGLLAVQILATHQPELLEQVQHYRQTLAQSVIDKQKHLDCIGYSEYLKQMNRGAGEQGSRGQGGRGKIFVFRLPHPPDLLRLRDPLGDVMLPVNS